MFRPAGAINRIFSLESVKVFLYNSRDGVLMKRSRHQTQLEHSTPILGVWVNHLNSS